MKTPATYQKERAVALIIVLAMLLLLSGLIVSFMTSVGNERAASVASNNEITTRQLADSTVNLVIGQIRQATTQAEAADAGRPATTWASQPGAIRTFSGTVGPPKFITTGAAGVIQFTYKAGSNDYVFKLYSAENMKVKASDIENNGWFGKETELIEKWDWAASEGEREKNGQIGYTDLNTPVMSPLPSSLTKGNSNVVEPRYPIIDPRASF